MRGLLERLVREHEERGARPDEWAALARLMLVYVEYLDMSHEHLEVREALTELCHDNPTRH